MEHKDSVIYKKSVLPNGLTVITESIPYVRSVSLGLWLNVGSRDESTVSSGISHFVEHMVFKATKNRNASQIASFLESVGGTLNAFTSREQTCYYAKFLDEHLAKGVEILSDLVNNASFSRSDIEKEKKVVLEEISDIEDSPGDLVHDLFAATVFGKHPLGRPIMGDRRSVKNMNRAKILRYVNKHYRCNKMVLAACGNLDHDVLADLAEKYFGNLSPLEHRNGRTKPSIRPIYRSFNRKTAQTHICLGIQALSFNHESRPAMLILNSILGGGMSSRFFQRLRENLGLVYTVFSYVDFFMDVGLFGIYLGTEKKNVRSALSAIKMEIETICSRKLTVEELRDAKEQLKGGLVLGLENTSNRMNRLAKHEFLAERHISIDETIAGIDAVGADEIVEISRVLFTGKRFSGVSLGSVKKDIFSALEH
ncbi:MAG: insulinase family protein [Candidatus Zixiibacteriota bacterium]|nr:MAG: insulinase family protein [candidate division Zixibacteria bacterium]